MMSKIIALVLIGAVFTGCTVAPEKPKKAVVAAKPRKKKAERLLPKSLSVVAPSDGRSDTVIIPCGWACTFRTVPSGQPLRVWINGEDPPVTFFFSQTPQFFEHAQSIQFGSTSNDSTYVKAILYPPGVPVDVSVRSE